VLVNPSPLFNEGAEVDAGAEVAVVAGLLVADCGRVHVGNEAAAAFLHRAQAPAAVAILQVAGPPVQGDGAGEVLIEQHPAFGPAAQLDAALAVPQITALLQEIDPGAVLPGGPGLAGGDAAGWAVAGVAGGDEAVLRGEARSEGECQQQ